MIQQRIKLYELDYPYVDTYINDPLFEGDARGAVIVVPGGGYEFVSDREGEAVALRFSAAGFHTFVLYYRVAPEYHHPCPVEDLARTVSLVRKHAAEWNVDPDNISICGFSAGGHLCAHLGVYWNDPELSALIGEANEQFKPNQVVLGYPVITSSQFTHRGSFENLTQGDAVLLEKLSLEKHVSADTPPTFLWHTAEDAAVPVENSLLFASALSANGVPFELHVYPHGPHGLSLANQVTSVQNDDYIHDECAHWIEEAIRFIQTENKRK